MMMGLYEGAGWLVLIGLVLCVFSAKPEVQRAGVWAIVFGFGFAAVTTIAGGVMLAGYLAVH